MTKRLMDILLSTMGLVVFSPVLIIFMLLVWLQDRHSPFYVAKRVGKGNVQFNMVKLRSMIKNADKSGVSSTSNNDNRITWIGAIIRKYKLDEITQLINVLKGEMSLVGPRPNVEQEVKLYSELERNLLNIKPGITDFASIIFSDEGKILENKSDPDLAYNQLIRPWKSELGLFYITERDILLDIELILLTLIAIFSKQTALNRISKLLHKLGAREDLILIANREVPLVPTPPPGMDSVVQELAYR